MPKLAYCVLVTVGLSVGCGQGFYLARPNLGNIQADVPQLTAAA